MLFECWRNGERSGLRCEDHGEFWRDYVMRDGNTKAALVPVEVNDACDDCYGEISGHYSIVDVDHAWDVYVEACWDERDNVWRNSATRSGFVTWLRHETTGEIHTFQFDRMAVIED